MTYHIFVNEAFNSAMIHESDCGDCNFGKGKQPNAGKENCYWHGPIQNKQDAFFVALNSKNVKTVHECEHCCGR